MLTITDLHVSVEGKPILKGIDLEIAAGQLHALMGRNGSGKSTLAHVIAGREGYQITQGKILYRDRDLTELSPEVRALEGIFLSFQYPAVIPGVNLTYFLKAALNAQRQHRGQAELDALGFLKLIKERLKLVGMDPAYLSRGVNEGFSGGEKKLNEILQLLTLEPYLTILDETDSGLDIDALKIVAAGVNTFRRKDRAILAITHYQRLLDYMSPDHIHVLIDGKIVLSGGPEVARELEARGYAWLEEEPLAAEG